MCVQVVVFFHSVLQSFSSSRMSHLEWIETVVYVCICVMGWIKSGVVGLLDWGQRRRKKHVWNTAVVEEEWPSFFSNLLTNFKT